MADSAAVKATQAQQQKETAAYLLRGRRFADVSAEALEDRWVEAFRRFAAAGRPADADFDDIRAEYALREQELPMGRLAEDWKAFLARIQAVEIPGKPAGH